MSKRARSFRVEAVVLRHRDIGEADRLLWLYTRQQGKLRVVAKGARKVLSRKAGHLEPLTHVALQLARARSLPIVTQAETLDAYLPLREDLTRMGYALYVLELLDRFTPEAETNPALYHLLVQTLSRLLETPDQRLTVRYYEIRLLDLLGFRPQLFTCLQCGAEIRPEDQYFGLLAGGVLCPHCGEGHDHVRPVSLDALRYLRHFQRSAYAEALRARPSDATHEELETLMQAYFTYLLERRLNTPDFLRRVGRQP